jgi:hypothetical protein
LGRSPMMTNSVVPIPNAATARARRGNGMAGDSNGTCRRAFRNESASAG